MGLYCGVSSLVAPVYPAPAPLPVGNASVSPYGSAVRSPPDSALDSLSAARGADSRAAFRVGARPRVDFDVQGEDFPHFYDANIHPPIERRG